MSATQQRDLERALSRARELGRPVLCFTRLGLSDWPDLVDLFVAAGTRGERRFLSLHPSEGVEQLALGCAAEFAPPADAKPDGVGDTIRATQASADASFRDAVRGEGAHPAAVGGFAFAGRALSERDAAWAPFEQGSLVVPELLFTREDGEAMLVQARCVAPEAAPEALAGDARARYEALVEKAPERTHGGGLSAAPQPRACYERRVTEALAALVRGDLGKVVLADCVEVALPSSLHEGSTLRALCAANPTSRTFAQGIGEALFLGASPERIARLRRGVLASDAVAGTRPAPDSSSARDALGRELLDSPKDRREHEWVVRHLVDGLEPLCDTLTVDVEPNLVRAGSIQHLRTRVRGRAAAGAHVLEALARLHPSPALAGTPRDTALAWIRLLEGFDRGWYGGSIGWVGPDGEGDFFAALRCGLVTGERVRLYAGSGVVASSQPSAERDETALKLGTLWRALHAT